MFSQLIQLQSRLQKGVQTCLGVLADSLCFRGPPHRWFSAGSERSQQTAALAKSSLATYLMTLGGPGAPRPTCTLFFGDKSSISEEAWEKMKQNKCPVRNS